MKRKSIFEALWEFSGVLNYFSLSFLPSTRVDQTSLSFSCSRLSHLTESNELTYNRTLFIIFSAKRELKTVCAPDPMLTRIITAHDGWAATTIARSRIALKIEENELTNFHRITYHINVCDVGLFFVDHVRRLFDFFPLSAFFFDWG